MEDKVMCKCIKSFLLLLIFVCSQDVLSAVSHVTAHDFLDVIKKATNIFAQGDLKNNEYWLHDQAPEKLTCHYVQKIEVDSGTELAVVGDIHGNKECVDFILEDTKNEEDLCYVFLGDYIDRGENGVEVLYKLLKLKLEKGDHVILHRGNHEFKDIYSNYGFKAEVERKFSEKAKQILESIDTLFSYLPLVTFICCGRQVIMCCHGAMSKSYTPKALLQSDKKFQEITDKNVVDQLVWNDLLVEQNVHPMDTVLTSMLEVSGFYPNIDRGIGDRILPSACKRRMYDNMLDLFFRGHQNHELGVKLLDDQDISLQDWKNIVKKEDGLAYNEFYVNEYTPIITIASGTAGVNCYVRLKTDSEYDDWIVNVRERVQ